MYNLLCSISLIIQFTISAANAFEPVIDGLHPVGPPVPSVPFEGVPFPNPANFPGTHPNPSAPGAPLPNIGAPTPWHMPTPPIQPPLTYTPFNIPPLTAPPAIDLPAIQPPFNGLTFPNPGLAPPPQPGGFMTPQLWNMMCLSAFHNQKMAELGAIAKSIGCAISLFNQKLAEPNILDNPNSAAELDHWREALQKHNTELIEKRDEIYRDYDACRNADNNHWVDVFHDQIGSTGANPIINANAAILSDMTKTVQEHKKYQDAKAASAAAAAAVTAAEQARVDKNVNAANTSGGQVREVFMEATQILSRVTPAMEEAAARYVREQLQNAQSFAGSAIDAAQLGASEDVVRLLGQYGLDLGNAIKDFLSGVHQGVNGELVSTAEAAAEILSNPMVIANLSNNIMRLLTGSPDQIFSAGKGALTQVGKALLDFEVTMTNGTPTQRGVAIGSLATNVLLGLAGGQAIPEVKAGIEGLAKAISGGATAVPESLGGVLRQGIHSSPALGPQISVFSNLRSIVELLTRYNLDLDARREIIEAFTQNSRVIRLTEDRTVYRYWKEGASYPRGNWVTTDLIDDPRSALALPKDGPYQTKTWIIPAGTDVIEGLVSPKFDMPGGGRQIYVPDKEVLR